MKTFAFLCLAALLLPLSGIGANPEPAPALEGAKYAVDGGHSTVLFRVKHLGVSNFYGRFNEISGSFVIGDKPSDSSVKIEVKTESIDTNSAGRDRHLKSPDFFNAKQFPVLSFVSTKVSQKDGNIYEVTGELSCHGETKTVTMEMEKIGEREAGARFGYRAGFEAVFELKRSDYGMNFMVDNGALGDTIKVFVSIEGQRQDG